MELARRYVKKRRRGAVLVLGHALASHSLAFFFNEGDSFQVRLWILKRNLTLIALKFADAWLLLGNYLTFCLLWFSGKSPLNC